MKTIILIGIPIALFFAILGIIVSINDIGEEEVTELDCFLTDYWDGTKCVPFGFETNVEPEQFKAHPGLGMLNHNEQENIENKIPHNLSDNTLRSKAYIANCDETIHKEEMPDLTIENSTHNYDMQYCKWELKYPDLAWISNSNLPNNHLYCAELFDTLFDYYQSIRDPCGMQRYNEDGTPRGVCEPAPAGAGVPHDSNMVKSGCASTYDKWAYLTEHNDDVFYLFD